MEWSAEGFVLGLRPQGETAVVLEVLTAERGRHFGLVRQGRTARVSGFLQAGNSLHLTWRARLEDHLGHFTVEPMASRVERLMADRLGTYGFSTLAGLLRYLPERDPHPRLYALSQLVLDHLDDRRHLGGLMARVELALLDELGFGLDLSKCAATGAREDLAYVSPRSGRAVSRSAGLPYHARMLALPEFLLEADYSGDVGGEDLARAFALTGFFLERHVAVPRNQPLPIQRDSLIALFKER